jgi:hypothetical protein
MNIRLSSATFERNIINKIIDCAVHDRNHTNCDECIDDYIIFYVMGTW